MVPGSDCMEDGRMCPNGIHHAAKGFRREDGSLIKTWQEKPVLYVKTTVHFW